MPETFIVTVMDTSGRFETDLEIPSRLPFIAFKAKLLEILKMMDSHAFGGWPDYYLRFKSQMLSDNDTLANVGAFDGSRLVAERVRL